MHCGVGHVELWRVHDRVSKQEDVDINYPRTFWADTTTAHFLLDLQYPGKKLLGHQLGLQSDCAIDEPRLVDDFHRCRLIERGHGDHIPQFAQPVDCGAQVSRAIIEVRAQRKIDHLLHARILAVPERLRDGNADWLSALDSLDKCNGLAFRPPSVVTVGFGKKSAMS